ASQGQQRTVVCAFKLAEWEMYAARKGRRPPMLMDDVLSELDPEHQRYLLGVLSGKAQVFITATRLSHVEEFASGAGLLELPGLRLGEV
ncbi:MAG: DNA replication and repair protein RecF, partial [Firmicutes bacterium]|nr:DNA replication and repair protein RecF [Bacillota bacterium]